MNHEFKKIFEEKMWEIIKDFNGNKISIEQEYPDKKSIIDLYHITIKWEETVFAFVIEKVLIESDAEKYENIRRNLSNRCGYTFTDCYFDLNILIEEIIKAYGGFANKIIESLRNELNDHHYTKHARNLTNYVRKKNVSWETMKNIYNKDDLKTDPIKKTVDRN